jgi:hypothetical protein
VKGEGAKNPMTTATAVPLAASIAARVAAVNALALLAAIVVAVSVVGILVSWFLFDPSCPRPYRLATASPRRGARPTAEQEIRYAA